MYVVEWPCCHDPLSLRLGFDDLLLYAQQPPPVKAPIPRSSRLAPQTAAPPPSGVRVTTRARGRGAAFASLSQCCVHQGGGISLVSIMHLWTCARTTKGELMSACPTCAFAPWTCACILLTSHPLRMPSGLPTMCQTPATLISGLGTAVILPRRLLSHDHSTCVPAQRILLLHRLARAHIPVPHPGSHVLFQCPPFPPRFRPEPPLPSQPLYSL